MTESLTQPKGITMSISNVTYSEATINLQQSVATWLHLYDTTGTIDMAEMLSSLRFALATCDLTRRIELESHTVTRNMPLIENVEDGESGEFWGEDKANTVIAQPGSINA